MVYKYGNLNSSWTGLRLSRVSYGYLRAKSTWAPWPVNYHPIKIMNAFIMTSSRCLLSRFYTNWIFNALLKNTLLLLFFLFFGSVIVVDYLIDTFWHFNTNSAFLILVRNNLIKLSGQEINYDTKNWPEINYFHGWISSTSAWFKNSVGF